MKITFEDFWGWLRKNPRRVKNLGGNAEFEIKVLENDGVCIPQSTLKKHSFNINQAKKIWVRFQWKCQRCNRQSVEWHNYKRNFRYRQVWSFQLFN
jgi:hypothetical protein